MSDKPFEILLVEDNPADVRLTREAFKTSKFHSVLNVVKDGVEAMDYLRKSGSYAAVHRPDLILLDLSLPRKDGREVLAEIKNDEELKQIPWSFSRPPAPRRISWQATTSTRTATSSSRQTSISFSKRSTVPSISG